MKEASERFNRAMGDVKDAMLRSLSDDHEISTENAEAMRCLMNLVSATQNLVNKQSEIMYKLDTYIDRKEVKD